MSSTIGMSERAEPAVVPVAGAFRLDGWLVEPSRNRLVRGARIVHLRPQLIDILACLARRPGRVVSKANLLSVVWSDRFVAETAVGRCMCELRRALADDAREPRIIETIPKRGYRLMASIEPLEAPEPPPETGPETEVPALPAPRPAWQGRLASVARALLGASAALPELVRQLARKAAS